jgi:UDP-2,3-diacylglucosamine hydrolase
MTQSIAPGQIFVIGDSHIGLADGNEKPINDWLDRLKVLRPKALYLNGDLFHYLIAHRKFFTPSVDKVFRKFREVVDSGVPIHYVEGNRDFFIKGSFVEDVVTDVGVEYEIRAGERKYLVVHGDMINDRDWPYRFWRRVSKNRVMKLGLELIPRRIARRFVDSVEKRLASSNFKHKARLPVEMMAAYGRKRGQQGFTHVVFGHFHHQLVLPGEAGATIAVLPAWYESGEAMAIDPATGTFEFVTI